MLAHKSCALPHRPAVQPARNPLRDPEYLHFPIRLFLYVNCQVPACGRHPATCFLLSDINFWPFSLSSRLNSFSSPQPRALPADTCSIVRRYPIERKAFKFVCLWLVSRHCQYSAAKRKRCLGREEGGRGVRRN